MANNTGGTAAPSIRMNAAAQALGAPKAIGQRAQRSTSSKPRLPRVGGQQHGITQHQAAPQRAPQQHAARAAAPRGQLLAFNPGERYLNSQQLAKLGTNITRENAETQLQPLRQQSREIGGAENTALNRYQGMSQTGQQVLQGLQAGEEASAKTAQNNAAEAALQASRQIETSGQNAASATAGYQDPQVQQALAASQGTAAGQGGSAAASQQAMAASGSNLISNIRAAAAQRVTEGAGKLSQIYGQAQAKDAAEQRQILARQPEAAKSLAADLGQKQFTDQLTARSLGVKTTEEENKAQEAKSKARNEAARIRATERGQNVTLTLGQAKNATALKKEEMQVRGEIEKQGLANAGAMAKEQIKAKTALEVANKKAGRLPLDAENKAIGELSNTFTSIRGLVGKKAVPRGISGSTKLREILTKGEREFGQEVNGKTKVAKEKVAASKNGVLIAAAIEAWYYHKVSPITERQLKSMGIRSVPHVQNGELAFS